MTNIQLFDEQEVRRHWRSSDEQWFFSVVDVVAALTGSKLPKRYWSDLKRKLTAEGSQLYEKIVQLKFEAADGQVFYKGCV